jgi:multiple sugar transport system ATP-binding protein
MATVTLDHIRKVYKNGSTAVHDLNLDVRDGEFLVLVGPSGCGKSTILRMLAGLEPITSGEIRIDDVVVNDIEPKDRDIAMVFQNYALYPHMTVAGNIGFALKVAGVSKSEIDRRVREAAEILGLTDWLGRKPAQLSGGQRQRVAMGRAIVREPTVFLMDEPLSNLDAKLRVQTRAEVSRIQQRLAVSTVYVTHDQVEAMTMGHRVAVMSAGYLAQCDTPFNLYEKPANMFVAEFIGSPAMNLFEATLSPAADAVKLGSQELALPAVLSAQNPRLSEYGGKRVALGVRPEHVSLHAGTHQTGRLQADVDLVEQLGAEQMLYFRIDAAKVRASEGRPVEEQANLVEGDGVARVEADAAVSPGSRVELYVDVTRLHFFDRETERAII